MIELIILSYFLVGYLSVKITINSHIEYSSEIVKKIYLTMVFLCGWFGIFPASAFYFLHITHKQK